MKEAKRRTAAFSENLSIAIVVVLAFLLIVASPLAISVDALSSSSHNKKLNDKIKSDDSKSSHKFKKFSSFLSRHTKASIDSKSLDNSQTSDTSHQSSSDTSQTPGSTSGPSRGSATDLGGNPAGGSAPP